MNSNIIAPSAKLIFWMYLLYTILNIAFPMELGSNRGQTAERIYPQVCMALLTMYCSIYTIINASYFIHHQFFSAFFIYFIFVWIYAIFPSMMEVDLYGRIIYIMKFTIALSMMFCLYLSILDGEEVQKYIYLLFFVCLIGGFWNLYRDMQYVHVVDSDIFDSNSGFLLASCIPMTFMLPQERLRSYIYLLVFVGTILSGQRAAFLGALVTIPFALRYIKGNLKNFDIFLFIIIFFAVAFPYIINAIDNQIARHYADMQYEDRYGGGRLIFWGIILDDLYNSDAIQWLFGHLNDSVPALLKTKLGADIDAHNGWLQNLYTYGLFGLFLYIRCYIKMFSENKYLNTSLPEYKHFFLLMFTIFFIRSTVSHGNFDIAYIPFCLAISILIAKSEQNQYLEEYYTE